MFIFSENILILLVIQKNLQGLQHLKSDSEHIKGSDIRILTNTKYKHITDSNWNSLQIIMFESIPNLETDC